MNDIANPVLDKGRLLVLDTESTGLDPEAGHRIIEIGIIEMVDGVVTGNHLHLRFNPQRPIDKDAIEVHGINDKDLENEPLFEAAIDTIIDFLADDPIAAHNARFDASFLEAEFKRLGRPVIHPDRYIDTIALARRKYPGSPAGLDALCKRFNIDLSRRSKHGALLDAELLAAVIIELSGGRQRAFELSRAAKTAAPSSRASGQQGPVRQPRPHQPNEAEIAAHAKFLEKISDPIWNQ